MKYSGVVSVRYEIKVEVEAKSRMKAIEEMENMGSASFTPPAHVQINWGPVVQIEEIIQEGEDEEED